MKEIISYVALALGVLGIGGGLTATSRGITLGWAAVAVGVVLVAVAFKALRSPTAGAEASPTEPS